eukprot:Awhi_evm1s721
MSEKGFETPEKGVLLSTCGPVTINFQQRRPTPLNIHQKEVSDTIATVFSINQNDLCAETKSPGNAKRLQTGLSSLTSTNQKSLYNRSTTVITSTASARSQFVKNQSHKSIKEKGTLPIHSLVQNKGNLSKGSSGELNYFPMNSNGNL